MTLLLIAVAAVVLLGRSNAGAQPSPAPTQTADPGQEVLGAVLNTLEKGAAWLNQQVTAANEANGQPAPKGSLQESWNNIFGTNNPWGSEYQETNAAESSNDYNIATLRSR